MFISHAGEEKDFARLISQQLDGLGLRPFFDVIELRGTADNDRIMLRSAEEAPVGVTVLSHTFFQKKWPLEELWIIKQQQHTLLPVLYNMKFADLKSRLKEKPSAMQASNEEWGAFAHQLLYTTLIKQESEHETYVSLSPKVVFAAVRKCYEACKDDLPEVSHAEQFLGRTLAAAERLMKDSLFDDLPRRDFKEADLWVNQLKVLQRSRG